MKALESPQMVSAFHGGGTLEIARTNGQQSTNFNTGNSTDPAVTLHPPASAFSVMTGSVIPAVLVSGINSDLPGPILAQVSQNVFDSATGKYLLVPQGSRLIGAYQNASAYGQQRVEIAWQRLIFPNTSSMTLPQMPGADQGGYAGFHRRGEQPLPENLRHRRAHESYQRRPDGRTDGDVRRRRRFLRTVWLLPAEPVGDGEPDGRVELPRDSSAPWVSR